jgi:hypothetical protein
MSVGKHRRRRGYGARCQNFGEVREQEGFAAGHEDFASAAIRRTRARPSAHRGAVGDERVRPASTLVSTSALPVNWHHTRGLRRRLSLR